MKAISQQNRDSTYCEQNDWEKVYYYLSNYDGLSTWNKGDKFESKDYFSYF